MIEAKLQELETSARARLADAGDAGELESVRVDVLGRKGILAQLSKEMGKVPPEARAAVGKQLNVVKQVLESLYEERKAKFESEALDQRLRAEWLDLTLPAPGTRPGSRTRSHSIQQEIEELFVSLGFTVLDGPEVETEYHNFDALNLPPEHPARDMQDTFWLSADNLLRTHTSPGAGARHGAAGPAAAHDRARPRLPQRERGRLATSTPSTSSRA